MANLSEHRRAYNTDKATAVAADIETGKTAYVNGGVVTGTGLGIPLDSHNGVLLECVNPTGGTDSAYNATTEFGATIVKESNITPVSIGTWNLDTAGYVDSSTSYNSLWRSASMVAKTTSIRKFEMWGKTKDAALTDGAGIWIVTNWVDGNNYWIFKMRWNSAAGAFRLEIQENTGGAFNVRASTDIPVAVDVPFMWHITVFDLGDGLIFTCIGHETDAPADIGTVSAYYTVASRPNKTGTGFMFGNNVAATDEWLIRGCRISDV